MCWKPAALRPAAHCRPPPSRPGCTKGPQDSHWESVQQAVKQGEVKVRTPRPCFLGMLNGGPPHSASRPPGPQGPLLIPCCGFPLPCPCCLKGSPTVLYFVPWSQPMHRTRGLLSRESGRRQHRQHWTLSAGDQARTSPKQLQHSRLDS